MGIQKKALAVAIGAALCAPSVFAQNIEVYGKVYPELATTEGSGASSAADVTANLQGGTANGTNAIKNRAGMKASNSRVGFRGSEDLGAGMKAIFQIETQTNIDDGTAGFWATRNSFVGLDGGFGTLRFGRMDTTFKEYGDTLSFLGVSSGNFVSNADVLRKPGFGTSSSASFHLRRSNAVDYETPKMGGVTVGAQVSFGDPSEVTLNINNEVPQVVSLGVKYEAGPLYVAVAHETHENLFGLSRNGAGAATNRVAGSGATSKDTAMQAAVKYRMGMHTVEVDFIQKKYTESPGTNAGRRFKDYKNTAFLISAEQRWSAQWRTMAHFVKAQPGSCSYSDGSTCDTSGLDGTQISVGFANYLSKRTYVFGLFSQLTNGKSATYNNSDIDPNVGEDIRQMAVGVAHSF